MAAVGMQTGVSTGALNGARAAYEIHAQGGQEPQTNGPKSNPGSLRHNSNASSRAPLPGVTPSRRSTNEYDNAASESKQVEEPGMSRRPDTSGSRTNKKNMKIGGTDNDIPENMYKPEDDDPEGWIDRDKLAKIESEELQAAGINLAKARRNVSTSSKKEAARAQRSGYPSNNEQPNPTIDERDTPVTEHVEEEDEKQDWDLRTSEEIAADATASRLYANPVLRKSGSKIPVLTSSPLPIPQEELERDTPLPRKRTLSSSMSPDDGTPTAKSRQRQTSAGSQFTRQDGDGTFSAASNTPVSSSPTKQKSKPIPSPSPNATIGYKAARKTSTSAKGSATSLQRPGTRSGELDRPRTAINRPEGDPPWLATMYKPDPMLPPDQQIIPTHARRQQQEQWNNEGAIPTAYARDFSPLAVQTPEQLAKRHSRDPTNGQPILEITEDNNSWPLKPMNNLASNNNRPSTSGSVTGGYSTMPKVVSPVIIQSPQIRAAPSRVQDQRPPDEEEKVKDKGCGCCLVM